ncbi:MAG: iron hydrogenase [Candidatus Latescibacteria bacterium]|nr:iron hydrogenase [Candidatus Latescibacterota bacterium]
MEKFKDNILSREKTFVVAKFAIILGLSILAPLFKIQMITGPMVNALLFIATVILGPYSAILIGLLPSAFSLAVGLLPGVLVLMIPFIMISNAILILTFNYFQKKNYWLGMVSASILKYAFLFITSQILINFLMRGVPTAKVVVVMMSWPQLITALIGGIIAYFFLKFIKRI